MGSSDFNQGRNFAARQADVAIDEWKSFSNDLQQKLDRVSAREAGRDAQQRALREALVKLDPHHPLLKDLPKIGAQAMVESFANNGYNYDPATETLLRKL